MKKQLKKWGSMKGTKNTLSVRALSVAQPWAHCIVSLGKNVENRSWNTNLRGFIAIHSSAKFEKERFKYCYEDHRIRLEKEDVEYGHILGFAEIANVITKKEVTSKTRKWFAGEYGFVLKNVIRLKEPGPAKGSLGFWKVNGKTIDECLDQISSKKRQLIEKNLLR